MKPTRNDQDACRDCRFGKETVFRQMFLLDIFQVSDIATFYFHYPIPYPQNRLFSELEKKEKREEKYSQTSFKI